MTHAMAILISRAAALLFASALVLWPLVISGRVSPVNFFVAAPLLLAAIEPRVLGPRIGKAVIVIVALIVFYDPPNLIGLSVSRLLTALPFMMLGFLLCLPEFF